MFGEAASPLLACLFLEINALVIGYDLASLAHEATALWDASYVIIVTIFAGALGRASRRSWAAVGRIGSEPVCWAMTQPACARRFAVWTVDPGPRGWSQPVSFADSTSLSFSTFGLFRGRRSDGNDRRLLPGTFSAQLPFPMRRCNSEAKPWYSRCRTWTNFAAQKRTARAALSINVPRKLYPVRGLARLA